MRTQMKFKTRLIVGFLFILLISVTWAGFGIWSILKVERLESNKDVVYDLEISLLDFFLQEHEFESKGKIDRDFVADGHSPLITNIKALENQVDSIFKLVSQNDWGSQEFETHIELLRKYVDEYKINAENRHEQYFKLGFQDWGKEGDVRKAANQLENFNLPIDKSLLLTLRKHEKNFILRHDLRYLDSFNENISDLKEHIRTIDDENISLALSFAEEYHRNFNAYYEILEKIGLSGTQGLNGKLQDLENNIVPLLAEIHGIIDTEIDQEVAFNIVFLIGLLLVQIGVALLIGYFFSQNLSEQIVKIRDVVVGLSKGEMPEKSTLKLSDDELGQAHKALNELIERIDAAASYAKELGKGNLDMEYDKKFTEDVLAQALLNMSKQLKEIEESEKTRRWKTEGLAKFADILRDYQDDASKLYDQIIAGLVKYLGANQGMLFVLEEDAFLGKQMVLRGTHAWSKKRFMDKTISEDEGLIGQAWKERSIIHLREVPEDFVYITSGLGKSNPKSVLIVPLKVEEEVFGVMEIASFKKFAPHEVEFVEELSRNIASSLAFTTNSEKTKALLESSNQQAEEMRATEEEMRQNMEELEATQEGMKRQEQEYVDTINELRQQIKRMQGQLDN